MKIKICCKELRELIKSGGLTILPEGNILLCNDYTKVELIYCPFCGKKIKWIN
jgi:hypothetical protein